MLEIETDDRGDHALCRPVGELDAYTVSAADGRLASIAGRRCHLVARVAHGPSAPAAQDPR